MRDGVGCLGGAGQDGDERVDLPLASYALSPMTVVLSASFSIMLSTGGVLVDANNRRIEDRELVVQVQRKLVKHALGLR